MTRITLMSSFEMYLKVMFFAINDVEMMCEPFHKKIAEKLEQYVFGENEKRNLGLSLPVGSGKSLFVQYFISWCFARSIHTTFLYISHSSMLINKLSQETKEICQHPIWVTIFGQILKKDEKSKTNWKFEGAKNRTGLTAGTMGSGITGLDAGNTTKLYEFTGALIIDDPVDAGKIKHENAREECVEFYNDKLETRRRTRVTPTILIMQRLHVADLIGYLKSIELDLWEFLEIPALQVDGTSFWEERYPLVELNHLRNIKPFIFYAQYQQNPIVKGGNVIRSEWFDYWEIKKDVKPMRILITGDTAQKTKEHNDFSVFCAWVFTINKIYLMDIIRGKWEAPELLEKSKTFINRWSIGFNNKRFNGVYIEDKASGTGLIQTLKREIRTPIFAIQRNTDKLTRVTDSLDTIAARKVMLPYNPNYGLNPVLLSECESFSRDGKHKHDDIIDNICDACDLFQTGYTREDLL